MGNKSNSMHLSSLKYMHFNARAKWDSLATEISVLKMKEMHKRLSCQHDSTTIHLSFLLSVWLRWFSLRLPWLYELQSLELCHSEDLHQKSAGNLKRP